MLIGKKNNTISVNHQYKVGHMFQVRSEKLSQRRMWIDAKWTGSYTFYS